MVNILQKLNSEILVIVEDWDMVIIFGAMGPKMVYLA